MNLMCRDRLARDMILIPFQVNSFPRRQGVNLLPHRFADEGIACLVLQGDGELLENAVGPVFDALELVVFLDGEDGDRTGAAIGVWLLVKADALEAHDGFVLSKMDPVRF